MSEHAKLYIAGIGMITPVGFDTASTAAAVKAGVSGYRISNFYGVNNKPITMATVPNRILDELNADINETNQFNERHDRVTRMAIIALREACAQCDSQAIPLVLAMPEEIDNTEGMVPLIENLVINCQPWLRAEQNRSIHTGRAAGIEAIHFAFRYINDLPGDYMLIGGSDSYRDYSRITPLSKQDRLLSEGNMDGFVPGEAASFILLTGNRKYALKRNGNIIALHAPGIAVETGHLNNEQAYRGDGLDQAFKQALSSPVQSAIHTIYSSMNGENHWAKEYGVAYLRNKSAFLGPVKTEHPVDIFGDLGAATGPALVALAAEDLYRHPTAAAHLVYSSSDGSKRGAIVLEKQPAMTAIG